MLYSESIQKAILTNNQGVRQLESGNFDCAREMFRDALESLKLAISRNTQTVAAGEDTSSSNGFQWSKNAPLHAELGLPAPAGSSFIFRRALIIVAVSEALPNGDLTEESTAIIYNLALSCLTSGFVSNSSKLIGTSQKFFDIVLAIRQRKNESNKLTGEVLLDTAICNNLGWIHGEFCNYQAAGEYFQQVSSRIVTLSQFGQLNEQDCQGFIMNLMLESFPQLAAAA